MYKLKEPWQLTLASASPRRQRLLAQTGLEFKIQPVEMEEKINQTRPLGSEAQRLALLKALTFTTLQPHQVILTADTLVGINGQTLGKPASVEEAVEMLNMLSGNTHQVATGFCLAGQGRDMDDQWMESGHQLTSVTFRNLSHDEIRAYVACNQSMDKAGAYGIQKTGAVLVESINGNFHNVVGLPLAKVIEKMLAYNIITPHIQH